MASMDRPYVVAKDRLYVVRKGRPYIALLYCYWHPCLRR